MLPETFIIMVGLSNLIIFFCLAIFFLKRFGESSSSDSDSSSVGSYSPPKEMSSIGSTLNLFFISY